MEVDDEISIQVEMGKEKEVDAETRCTETKERDRERDRKRDMVRDRERDMERVGFKRIGVIRKRIGIRISGQ